MPIQQLSTDEIKRLPTLCVARIQLSAAEPSLSVCLPPQCEYLFYPLIGAVRLENAQTKDTHCLVAGRAGVRENPPQDVLYGVTGQAAPVTLHLLTVRGRYTADLLYVTRRRGDIDAAGILWCLQEAGQQHRVGAGTTHERLVYEIAPPDGMTLHAGETLNIPGGWSSWPPHAPPDIAQSRCAQHQEVFFVITPGQGVLLLDGWYANGEEARGVRLIENGTLLATPLGSHPIVFTPGAWGWYFWVYASDAITKTYNQFAHHVREYVQ